METTEEFIQKILVKYKKVSQSKLTSIGKIYYMLLKITSSGSLKISPPFNRLES